MNARFRSVPVALILLAALLFANIFSPRPAQANPGFDADINIFYDALAPYGNWVDHELYGRVWYPRDVPLGWRPYTDGHWDYTYEHGWVWVSDWDWGWAPFHYGRWAWDDWHGWIWVPGRIWAPAWVFWRYGGGYAAWAPMPPNVIWQPEYGLITHHFNYDRDLDRDCWVGVPEFYVSHRNIRQYIIEPRRNVQILNVTKNFTQVTIVNNTIVNHGVPVERIENISRSPVKPVHIREVERVHDRNGRDEKETLQVFRPRIRPARPEEIRRDEELAVKLGMEKEAKLRARPNRGDARSDELEVRIPDRLKGMMPSGQDVNLQPIQTKPMLPEREAHPFNGAGQAPMPLGRPEGAFGQTKKTKPRPPGVRKIQKSESVRPNNVPNSPHQTVHEEQDPTRPNRKSPNKVQPVEFPESGQEFPGHTGDQSGQIRGRELQPPEDRGRQMELQHQRQMEIRRQQTEQSERARKAAMRQQQLQEQRDEARRQELQHQRYMQGQREQVRHEELQRPRQPQQQRQMEIQHRQQLPQQDLMRQPPMEMQRQQAEQARRAQPENKRHESQQQEQLQRGAQRRNRPDHDRPAFSGGRQDQGEVGIDRNLRRHPARDF